MTPDRQKLLDRLLKLLALAHGTPFAAEAASARAMAEELMRNHGISPEEGKKEDRSQFGTHTWKPWAKGAQWEYRIVDTLAKLCGCETYWHGDFVEFLLVGALGDLEALRYLIGEVSNQRIRAWLKYKESGGSDGMWSFCFSFARALDVKIELLLSEARAITAQREKVKLWYESTHHINHQDLIGGQGQSAAGRAAGNSASLHRGNLGHAPRQIGYRRK